MNSTSIRWNEGRSLHVGINEYSGVYRDLLPRLSAAENDANAAREWCNRVGCSARVLLGSDATREAVTATLESTIERMIGGDLLVISFAGHGVSARAAATDPDGWDEAWCLHDGVLLDDEIHNLLAQAPENSEIVVLTDACFAAGIVDAQERATAIERQREALDQFSGAPIRFPTERDSIEVKASDFSKFLSASYGVQLSTGRLGKDALNTLQNQTFSDALFGIPAPDDSAKLVPLPERDGLFSFLPRAPRTRSADDAIAELLQSGELAPGALSGRSSAKIRAEVVSLSASAEGELAYEGPEHGLFTAAIRRTLELPGGNDFSYEDLMRVVRSTITLQTTTLGFVGTTVRTMQQSPALARASVAERSLTPKPGVLYRG